MKAPSVREGSKENRTQVTKNRICKRCLVWKTGFSVRKVELPDLALIQFLIANSPGAALGDGKKIVDRFMAGKPRLPPRSRSAKIPPGVDHALETGADLL